METFKICLQYLQNHTRRLYKCIEKKSLDIGYEYDRYTDGTSDRTKYWCEVLLRVPMMFIIHQWLLVSPYSDYWMIELVLFVVRYGVGFVIVAIWTFNCGVLLQAYVILAIDITITWIKQIDYWTIQNNAYEICHEQNVLSWSEVTDDSKLPLFCSSLLQLGYICMRYGAFSHRLKDNGTTVNFMGFQLTMMVPKILSCLSIFPAFMSELSYWIDSILLTVTIIFEIKSLMDEDIKVDEKKVFFLNLKLSMAKHDELKIKYKSDIENLRRRMYKRNQGENFPGLFPGKWLVRDVTVLFGIIYLFLLVLIEIVVYQRPIISVMRGNTLLEIYTMWCTTFITVLFISYCFGLISNTSVALGHWFLTSEIHIVEAFDINTGRIVQTLSIITVIESNLLGLENAEKLDAMKIIAFFSMYVIIFQTLDIIEQRVLLAVNSGPSTGILFYIRAIILNGLIITIPSLSTITVSRHFDISPWLLFFASGNCTLIFRSITLMLECALIKATWYTTNNVTRLEEVIHVTRVCKILTIIVFTCAQNYCRYICPLFKGWWVLRFCLTLLSLATVVAFVGVREFNRYSTRNRMSALLTKLQDVSFNTDTGETDDEDTHECAICYLEMTKAKKLPCKHVFHNDCLKKWFIVRTVCPLCNTEIKDITQV